MTPGTWNALMVVLLVAVVVMAVVLVALLRQVGTLMLRFPAPEPGPTSDGPPPGSRIDLAVLEVDKASIILFVSQGCAACEQILPALPTLVRAYPELQLVTVPVARRASERQAFGKRIAVPTRPDLFDLVEQWNIRGTPHAVALNERHRVVGNGVVASLEQLEALAYAATEALTDSYANADQAAPSDDGARGPSGLAIEQSS